MHWSRLVDVPIAALIRIGEIVLPTALAERVATVVWPAGLLLAFLIGVARLARELAGEAAARLALIFAALMAPVLQHFRPGAIDHHNLQLVLLVWSLALAAPRASRDLAFAGAMSRCRSRSARKWRRRSPRSVAQVALRWIVCGDDGTARDDGVRACSRGGDACPVRRHGAARALRGGGLRRAVDRARDSGGGRRRFGLALLTATRRLASPTMRLVAALVLGAAVAATLALAFPACLGDPYAHLDPRLAICGSPTSTRRAASLAMLRDLPQEVVPYYGLPASASGRPATAACANTPSATLGLDRLRGGARDADGDRALAGARRAAANAVAAALVPAALVRWLPVPRGALDFSRLGPRAR